MGHFRQTGSMLQLLMPWHLVSPSHQQLCYYTPHTPELLGGILVSLCPCVRPSRILCPLCSTYSPAWIQFIFIHFIKQLQNVCCVQSFLQNLNFWQFLKICNFVLFWLGIWCESLVWVIMGRWGGISERRCSSCSSWLWSHHIAGLILGWHPANERCRYTVTLSLIGWVHCHCGCLDTEWLSRDDTIQMYIPT